MDRKTAESYVLYGIKSTKLSRKLCWAFLLVNICLCLLALGLFHNLTFIVLVSISIIINIALSVIFSFKWSLISSLLFQSKQLVFFVFALDFINFGMYKISELFVWYEYLLSISLQLLAFIISIPIIISLAKKHDKNKQPYVNKTAGSVAAFFYALGTIFGKIYLTDASLSFMITILSILLSLMIYLLNIVIIGQYYRVYLIKKFRLDLNLE